MLYWHRIGSLYTAFLFIANVMHFKQSAWNNPFKFIWNIFMQVISIDVNIWTVTKYLNFYKQAVLLNGSRRAGKNVILLCCSSSLHLKFWSRITFSSVVKLQFVNVNALWLQIAKQRSENVCVILLKCVETATNVQ